MAEPPDLYQVTIQFDALHFSQAALTLNLLVRGASGEVTGSGETTKSLAPAVLPVHIHQVTGLFSDGQLHVSGEYIESAKPPAIGTFVGPFSAACRVDPEWNGRGSFIYGRYQVAPCVVRNMSRKTD